MTHASGSRSSWAAPRSRRARSAPREAGCITWHAHGLEAWAQRRLDWELNCNGSYWLTLCVDSKRSMPLLLQSRTMLYRAGVTDQCMLQAQQAWHWFFTTQCYTQVDPELAGHHEAAASPLEAVAKARWRKTLSQVQSEEASAAAATAAATAAAEAEECARTEGAPRAACHPTRVYVM